MKTKRTLLSIIVFLSVFWIPISISTDIFTRKMPQEQANGNPPVIAESNDEPQTSYEARYKPQASKYDYIASISDKIYSYEELLNEIESKLGYDVRQGKRLITEWQNAGFIFLMDETTYTR